MKSKFDFNLDLIWKHLSCQFVFVSFCHFSNWLKKTSDWLTLESLDIHKSVKYAWPSCLLTILQYTYLATFPFCRIKINNPPQLTKPLLPRNSFWILNADCPLKKLHELPPQMRFFLLAPRLLLVRKKSVSVYLMPVPITCPAHCLRFPSGTSLGDVKQFRALDLK